MKAGVIIGIAAGVVAVGTIIYFATKKPTTTTLPESNLTGSNNTSSTSTKDSVVKDFFDSIFSTGSKIATYQATRNADGLPIGARNV